MTFSDPLVPNRGNQKITPQEEKKDEQNGTYHTNDDGQEDASEMMGR